MSPKSFLGTALVLAPLMAILVASVWFAVYGWMATAGPSIPVAGYVAMAAGIVISLLVGVGLMSLVFYSRRHGYDDAADQGHRQDED